MCAIRRGAIWALDLQFDQTEDGRSLKHLNVIDEFSRECLAIEVGRIIDARPAGSARPRSSRQHQLQLA